MRNRHTLKRVKTSPLPREFLYFDCETTPEAVSLTETRLNFRLAVAVHCVYRKGKKEPTERWENFNATLDLWKWITDKVHERTALYVVAHNAEFDFRVSKGFSTLCSLGWTIRRFFLDGGKFTVWWQKGRQSLVILDSLQLLPVGIAALGQMLGHPKDTMPAFDVDDETWFAYCRRDVEVLAQAMHTYRTFVAANDLGGMAKTTAGQAFRAFRHRFMTEDIEIHEDAEALKLERDAYYGGRTECFQMGRLTGDEFYIYDVRSMYPSVMSQGLYPVQLIAYAENTSVKRLRMLVKRYHLIADVDLDTPEPVYPMRYNKRLVFATGVFRTALQGVELEHALDNDRVRNCYRSAVYFKVPVFTDYVNTMYGLRLQYANEGNEPFVFLTKRLLNSLYGKFGQRGFVYEEIGVCDPDECWQMEVVIEGDAEPVVEFAFGGKVYVRRRTEEAYDSFPAVAGAVTTYGRMKLWELINAAGRENVFYVDTDSLIVNQAGRVGLEPYHVPDVLGGLHLERIVSKVIIFGLKDYSIEGRRKTKGLKSKAVKVGEHKFIEEKWERFHSALSHGRLEDYRIRLSPKVLKLPYDKGTVLDDGRVIPFNFWEV
ncbi:hypothetical protein LCGC14_0779080 [marine sediment metagenome]|uniref:DNA-directed DNA polymerase n=1 Tax=marine sediment metagenome TaxID=412755 RepID=A0A0F9Q0B3_9ZZZZ